jgi:tetratricopeptide (TPR) repeat protein
VLKKVRLGGVASHLTIQTQLLTRRQSAFQRNESTIRTRICVRALRKGVAGLAIITAENGSGRSASRKTCCRPSLDIPFIMMKPRLMLVSVVAIILIVTSILLRRQFTRDADTGNLPRTQAVIGTAGVGPEAVNSAAKGNPEEGGEPGHLTKPLSRGKAFKFPDYGSFLDSLCPRLSLIDEERILAATNRDVAVLVGLAIGRSPRAQQFLSEALQRAPRDPLVNYAILSRNDSGFDRLRAARTLLELLPDDAEPFYAAALELTKVGDRDGALAYLREAAKRNEFGTLYQPAWDSLLNAYRLAGFPEREAEARILLERGQSIGDTALFELHNRFQPYGGGYVIAPGNEDLAALMLDGMQKALSSPGRILGTYQLQRGLEIHYLQAFLRLTVAGENPAVAWQYFDTPPAEMLAAAKAEIAQLHPVDYFYADKPGIAQRLTNDQRFELIERIKRDGELSAYSWAYQVRPDIFRSPDFPPSVFTKKDWGTYVAEHANP